MELVGEYIIVTGVRSQAEYEGGQLQMAPLSGMLTSSHILHKTLFFKGTSRPTVGGHAFNCIGKAQHNLNYILCNDMLLGS